MLLVGSVAVAQSNVSTVNQMGTANDALVVQAGLSNVLMFHKERPILRMLTNLDKKTINYKNNWVQFLH
jgi:hypothetical protein